MKDTEKTKIILKQSHSYYNPPVNAIGRLVSLAPDDCHNGTPDVWDTFIGHQDAAGDSLFPIYSILFCGFFIQALFVSNLTCTPSYLVFILSSLFVFHFFGVQINSIKQ